MQLLGSCALVRYHVFEIQSFDALFRCENGRPFSQLVVPNGEYAVDCGIEWPHNACILCTKLVLGKCPFITALVLTVRSGAR